MIAAILLIITLIVIGILLYFLFFGKNCACNEGKAAKTGENASGSIDSDVLGDKIPRGVANAAPSTGATETANVAAEKTSPMTQERQDSLMQVALDVTSSTRERSGTAKTSRALADVGVDDVMVISLDGSSRWPMHTVRNMESGGFKRNEYRRWRGVRGSALPKDTVSRLITPNLQYMIGCEEHQRHGKQDCSQYSLGAVGCGLSHWAAWYHVAHDPSVRAALVLEDDVYFKFPNTPEQVASLVDEAGGIDSFDFLRLDPYPSARDHQMCFQSVPVSRNLDRELGLTYHFTGYVVTKQGARKLLNRALPLYQHIDHVPSYLATIYPDEFFALMLRFGKSVLHQNRQIQSTIRV